MTFAHGSRSKLTPRDMGRFPTESLFDRVARAVCRAECLPRKELFESWEVARRVRRRMRGGRVLDLACGHGLTAQLMLLLDDTSPSATAIDTRLPASASLLRDELVRTWPRLAGRTSFEERSLAHVTVHETDVVLSVHACGALTDRVLELAVDERARVAVLPCCQSLSESSGIELSGWLDTALAVDVARVALLQSRGYDVHTQTLPVAITPKNRLLMGTPRI